MPHTSSQIIYDLSIRFPNTGTLVRINICTYKQGSIYVRFFLFFFSTSLLLSSLSLSWEVLPSTSFWTSRGNRCHPFSPPVRAFSFCRS